MVNPPPSFFPLFQTQIQQTNSTQSRDLSISPIGSACDRPLLDCKAVTHYDPVCASDGRFYRNECTMRREGCRKSKEIHVVGKWGDADKAKQFPKIYEACAVSEKDPDAKDVVINTILGVLQVGAAVVG